MCDGLERGNNHVATHIGTSHLGLIYLPLEEIAFSKKGHSSENVTYDLMLLQYRVSLWACMSNAILWCHFSAGMERGDSMCGG